LKDSIRTKKIDPKSKRYLLKYPPAIEKLIFIARSNDSNYALNQGESVLKALLFELNSFSIEIAA